MKTLLVTPYWYPWNASGTMRWLHIGQHLDFDVLTSKQPRKGFKDFTLPKPRPLMGHFFFGKRWPAVLWGFFAIFKIPHKYDSYVFTSPPESLIITAWVLEKVFRKKVLVDMRDSIARKNQKLKILNWVYKFFYRWMTHVVVAWQFIDPDRYAVHHGYDDIKLYAKPGEGFKPTYHSVDEMGNPIRYSYKTYCDRMSIGVLADYRQKGNVDWKNYAASSYPTIKKLGFEANVEMHPETKDFPLRSWEEVAEHMKMWIGAMHIDEGSIG